MEEMSGLEKKLKQIYFNDIIYFYFYLHKLHPNSTMFFNKNNSETAFCICAMFIYFSLTHYQKPIKWLWIEKCCAKYKSNLVSIVFLNT